MRVCWCYDGHVMIPVRGVSAWIPYKKTQLLVLYGTENYRIGPMPLTVYSKETWNQHTGICIRIKLANSSNENSQVHSSKKSSNLYTMKARDEIEGVKKLKHL